MKVMLSLFMVEINSASKRAPSVLGGYTHLNVSGNGNEFRHL